MREPVDPEEYARMRAIATDLWPLADRLEGFWGVEIGAAGPFVMMSPVGRHPAWTRPAPEGSSTTSGPVVTSAHSPRPNCRPGGCGKAGLAAQAR